MLDLSKRKYGKSARELIPEGIYTGTIVSVAWSENHEPDEAYVVTYELCDQETGAIYRHQEVFFNDTYNQRTAAFERMLDRHGIRELERAVGTQYKLTIKHERKHSTTFSNIVERTFIA